MPQLTTLIPSFTAPVTDRVWLVGAHGGAGCTTIRHSDPERFADAGRALPVSPDPSMPSRVILCAMGTGRGLESLRALLADQSAGLFGASILLGAAITDPAPRVPRPLVAARIQLSSAVRVWRLPHIKGLELDGFPPALSGRVLTACQGRRRHAPRHGPCRLTMVHEPNTKGTTQCCMKHT